MVAWPGRQVSVLIVDGSDGPGEDPDAVAAVTARDTDIVDAMVVRRLDGDPEELPGIHRLIKTVRPRGLPVIIETSGRHPDELDDLIGAGYATGIGLLMDGAAGTELMARGMPAGACTPRWALEHPEALLELQRAYAEAGSQVLLAPTFAANRVKLEQHGIRGQVADYNRRLAAIAAKRKKSAGKRQKPQKRHKKILQKQGRILYN